MSEGGARPVIVTLVVSHTAGIAAPMAIYGLPLIASFVERATYEDLAAGRISAGDSSGNLAVDRL
eukprot:11167324-Lingulodinium_polyedra.AAC.1